MIEAVLLGPEQPRPGQGPTIAIGERNDRRLVADDREGLLEGRLGGGRVAGPQGIVDRGVEAGQVQRP